MGELERVGDVMRRMFQKILDPDVPETEELSCEPKRYAVVRQDGTLTIVDVKKKGAIPLRDASIPWMRPRVIYRDHLD